MPDIPAIIMLCVAGYVIVAIAVNCALLWWSGRGGFAPDREGSALAGAFWPVSAALGVAQVTLCACLWIKDRENERG